MPDSFACHQYTGRGKGAVHWRRRLMTERNGGNDMTLEGVKIAALVEAEFEDLELLYPVMRFQEAGAEVTIIGTGSAETYKGKHGLTATADTTADKVNAADFAAIIVPGGWAPDRLRRYESVLRFVRDFDSAGKTVG